MTYRIQREIAPHVYTDYETFTGSEKELKARLDYLHVYVPGRYRVAEPYTNPPAPAPAEPAPKKTRKAKTK